MDQETQNKISDVLNNINYLPLSIHKNFMGSQNCEKLKNSIKEYKKQKPERMKFYGENPSIQDRQNAEYSNLTAWCSSYTTHQKTNLFNFYLSKILKHSEKIYNSSFKTRTEFIIEEFWIAEYKKGDYALRHNHINSLMMEISGCYYIDIEENASPILFDNEKPIYPENDMLVIFNSKLYHEIPKTNGKRLLVSFNIKKASKYVPTLEDHKKVVSIALGS